MTIRRGARDSQLAPRRIKPGDHIGVQHASQRVPIGPLVRLRAEGLTKNCDLDGQTEPEALGSLYGARPTEEFVQENWDVLRESCLRGSARPASRWSSTSGTSELVTVKSTSIER
jgi:hypothetical protein